MAFITDVQPQSAAVEGGFFARLFTKLMNFAETHHRLQARADLIEKLNKLSDKELAQRGMSRDTIALHVFRDTYYI